MNAAVTTGAAAGEGLAARELELDLVDELIPAEPDPVETERLQAVVEREAASAPPQEALPVVDARGIALVTLAVLASLFALRAASQFAVPLVLGVLLAYAFDPFVSLLARRHVPRPIGALVVLALVLTVCVSTLWMLRFQAQAIVDQVPEVVRKATRAADAFGPGMGFENLQRAVSALQKATDQATGNVATRGTVVVVQQPSMQVKDLFVSGGLNALELAGQLVMVVFLVYFILIAGDTFKRKFVKIAGRTLSEKKITVQMFETINLSIQRYLAVLLVTNVTLAALTWASFRIVGLDNAGTWGIVAGVLHVVPYFGPILVAAATGVAALVQFGSIGMALLVGGLSLLIATIVGLLLTTWMAGRIARMNTVAVFVGLLLFGWLWGVWGVLLSVPLVVIIKVVCDHVESLKPMAELLGD